MHFSTFVTVAIIALAQLAVCQSIDPNSVSDTTKGEILFPRNGVDRILILYRPMVQ